jgi:hypothetical protein
MNKDLFEHLLNESESTSLDFKSEQYEFYSTDDKAKSELLKDILAFANSFRRTDAYILIGVKEVKGGQSIATGIEKHLEDSDIQQFVNSKTQKPLSFLYIPYLYESKQVGIIYIPSQQRPYFLKQDFGNLRKDLVYIRHGSSTDIATPDEIAKMGAINFIDEPLIFEMQFYDLNNHQPLGKLISLKSDLIKISNDTEIPNYLGTENQRILQIDKVNKEYYKELFSCLRERYLFHKMGFSFKNPNTVLLKNINIHMKISNSPHLLFTKYLPNFPIKSLNINAIFLPSNTNQIKEMKRQIELKKFDDSWEIRIFVGDLQPKATFILDEPLFLGSKSDCDLRMNCEIFGDNIPNPINEVLSIKFITESVEKTITDLENMRDDIETVERNEFEERAFHRK